MTSTVGDFVDVIKLNTAGQKTWRYRGSLLQVSSSQVVLEAFFDREDMNLHGLVLARGDRFIETYFTDRWYNIFEIHSRDDDTIRGWYCNITRPAKIEDGQISYVDLALDLLVFPDGSQQVLDEDEFERLNISPEVRSQALEAMRELRDQFMNSGLSDRS